MVSSRRDVGAGLVPARETTRVAPTAEISLPAGIRSRLSARGEAALLRPRRAACGVRVRVRGSALLATLSLLAALSLVALPTHAQGARATVNRTEGVLGDQIVLTVSGDTARPPELPEMPDFDVRPVGTSTQLQIVNGRTSASVTFTYLLLPQRAGELVIGPITVEAGGTRQQTQPIKVHITEAAPPAAGPSAPGASPSYSPDVERRDLFITAAVSNPSPYLGEQIVYTWRLYTRVRMGEARLGAFELPGFEVVDLDEPSEYQATFQGQPYRVHEVRKALFPQQEGKLTALGPRLEVTVLVQRRARTGSIFDEVWGRVEREGRRLATPPVEVEVRSLPPAPPGWSGLVGRFDVDASLSKASLAAGESTTLKVTVSGTGNASMIGEPKLPDLSAFKVYDDKPTASLEHSGDEIRGAKTFVKALVPRQAGTLTLPGMSLVYFDPEAGAYRTAATEPLPITVVPANGHEDLRLTEAMAPTTGKVAVKVLADDLLPICRSLDAVAPAGPAMPLVLGGLAAPALAWVGLFLWQARQRRFALDRGLRRRQEALRAALTQARRAQQSAGSAPSGDAVALASRCLRQYIGDKLGLEGTALTPDEARAHLAARGVRPELVERVHGLLERLEGATYCGAGRDCGAELRGLLAELEGSVRQLEREIRANGERRRGLRGALAGVSTLLGTVLLGAALGASASAAGAGETELVAVEDDPAAAFVAANEAYQAGEFGRAAAAYERLVASGFDDGRLFYNLGNAYLRNGELGRAVAAYRAGQARRPRSRDLAANLDFARRSAKDALAPPAPPALASALLFWHYRASRGELGWLLLAANLLFWLCLAARLFRRREWLRWSALALGLAAAAAAGSLAVRALAPERVAVVVPQEVEARAAADPKALVRFKLHAGSEVAVQGIEDGWVCVALPTGETGWLRAGEAVVVKL